MSFFTKVRDAATFKAPAPGVLGKIQKLSEAPGSAASLVHAARVHKFNSPYGKDANSADIFAGGISARSSRIRFVGRSVGSYFAGASIAKAGVPSTATSILKGALSPTGEPAPAPGRDAVPVAQRVGTAQDGLEGLPAAPADSRIALLLIAGVVLSAF